MRRAHAFFPRLQDMARRRSSANGSSVGVQKGRRDDTQITVLSSLCSRVNAQSDNRSAAEFTGDFCGAAVKRHDALHDRQAQTLCRPKS